ncbi:hypothetical protein Tco_1464880 [Tanacetum coccineum]
MLPGKVARELSVIKTRSKSQQMSADVARGHGGDGGGDDRPPSHHIPISCGGCFANRGKGTRKANLGGRKAGRLHTRQETRNLGLKKITDDKGPVPIRFEWDDKKTMMPLGGHASHWSNYLGELIREMPLYYPSWQKVPAERKAAIVTKIGTQFDLTPHMQSQRWADVNAGIQQHLQKLYNTNKASLKAAHWIGMPRLHFGMNPRNPALAAQIGQNRAKSTVVCRQGSRSLARLRDEMREMVRSACSSSNYLSRCCPTLDEEYQFHSSKGKQQGTFLGLVGLLPWNGQRCPHSAPSAPASMHAQLWRCRKAEKEEQVPNQTGELDDEAF